MGGTIDATDVGAALLIEARALAAAHGDPSWPARARASTPGDLLSIAWRAYGLHETPARGGFALARRALVASCGDVAAPRSAPELLAVFDRAIVSVAEQG